MWILGRTWYLSSQKSIVGANFSEQVLIFEAILRPFTLILGIFTLIIVFFSRNFWVLIFLGISGPVTICCTVQDF